MRETRVRLTWLCTDCGLFCHAEQDAADHRTETGHTRVVVLTRVLTGVPRATQRELASMVSVWESEGGSCHERRSSSRRRSVPPIPAPPQPRLPRDDRSLDEKLAAFFGGKR